MYIYNMYIMFLPLHMWCYHQKIKYISSTFQGVGGGLT